MEVISSGEGRELTLTLRGELDHRAAETPQAREDSDAGINVVWVHISNLRKRLKAIGMTIQANRGLGYILEAER